MSFKRQAAPIKFASKNELTASMIGIGMRFSGDPKFAPNIENTLVAASIEGCTGDHRVMSLLVDWLDIHESRINADRLIKLVQSLPRDSEKVKRFWAAFAKWKEKDSRFKRLNQYKHDDRLDFAGEVTDSFVRRNGEDPRFENTCIRVPNRLFRHRPADIFSIAEFAKSHPTYRMRIMMGPSYRADAWAALKMNPSLSPAELARTCYSSYRTAYEVKKDFEVERSLRKTREDAE